MTGKTPVQLYVQAPYTEGGLEKSAIQLAGFAKTDILNPGQSATVQIDVDPALFASYDENEGDGAWVLDSGEYYFAVGNGAHAALNNILCAQGIEESKLVKTANESISADAAKPVTLGRKDSSTGNHPNRRASHSARHDIVGANSIAFASPLRGKTHLFRCSSSPNRTHYVGLRLGFGGADDRARMPPTGAAFGMAASVDPVRVHNETPSHGLRTRLWGCPGVESSRDPWYTPAQVLPDLTRTVPNLIRGASANVMRTNKANQYDWGNYRVYIRKQAKRP